jgi:atypical dual specificity phosphatase
VVNNLGELEPKREEHGRILGSANPSTVDLEGLRQKGFAVLICLLRDGEQSPNYDLESAREMGFQWHNIPVKDFTPPTVEQLLEFNEIVDGLDDETKIIIHCQGGMGRTGTFAAAYWISRGMAVEDAIKLIRRSRINAIETREQEQVLETFAVRLRPPQADTALSSR